MFVLVALPVVAEPPVVLPLTSASPVLASCSLVLQICKLLLLFTVVVLVCVETTVLLELGPVLLIPPVAFMVVAPPAPPDGPLLMVTDAMVALALLA